VWLVARPDASRGDLVGPDHEAASEAAVDYLKRRGHLRVAFFDPALPRARSLDPGQTFGLVGAKRGLNVQMQQAASRGVVRWPVDARVNQEQVVPLVEAWAEQSRAERATVIVVPGDDVAFQLFAAFHGRGIAVGREVSVFSMRQERGLVAGLLPRLASIDIQAEEIGRRAIDQLRWRLDHPGDRPFVNILVRGKLVEGDSVAKLA
jgi:DNA-binding LacI/PurR family transcriptional regulator